MSEGNLAPLRVLHLIKGLGRGGAERLVVLLASLLHEEGVHSEVAYVDAESDELIPELRRAGVVVHLLESPLPGVPLRRLRTLCRERRIDVLHSHSPLVGAGARLAARRLVPVLVHTEHNAWDSYHPLTRAANAGTYARLDLCIAVSDGVRQSIRTSGRGPRVEVLQHGIDLSAFHQAERIERASVRAEFGIPEGAVAIGTVASMSRKKNHEGLLTAFASVVRGSADCRLILAGSGPLEAHLKGMTKQLGLGGRVVFAGSRDDVPRLLQGFDVFCLPSHHEGLPLALVEAMASGLACVATEVGGVGEVIAHERTGLLVPPGNGEALAASLWRVIKDEALRDAMGRAALRRAQDFGINRAVRAHAQWYRTQFSGSGRTAKGPAAVFARGRGTTKSGR